MHVRVVNTCGIIAAACALISLVLPSATMAAPPGPDLLDRPMRGEAAVAALGERLPSVALRNRMSAGALAALLRRDATVWVDQTGMLHVKDPAPSDLSAPAAPDAAAFPDEQTFKLHSKPGAQRSLYLDFNGEIVSGTAWNTAYGLSAGAQPAFDLDGNPGGWSQSEHDLIQGVYERVAEDFRPFDIDVTTEDPGPAALDRSDSADPAYGTRVLISPSEEASTKICSGGCGGYAYIGVFNSMPSSFYQPAWVFPHILLNGEKYIAEAASHEAGHNLGLRHDGTSTQTYYRGGGGWAPIMGSAYSEPISQWSSGEYPDANNTQDDISVMQSYGLPLRPDDHGSSTTSARSVGAAQSIPGNIERREDHDFYTFSTTCTAATTVTVTPAAMSPNLDVRLRLLNASGAVLAEDDPLSTPQSSEVASGLSASITRDLGAGTYFVDVDGVGARAPATVGYYSDYGSLGAYSLAVAGCAAQVPSAPTGVSAQAGDRSAVVSWSAGASDGGAPVTSYTVTASPGGQSVTTTSGAARSATVSGLTNGTSYTFRVTATNSAGSSAASAPSNAVTPVGTGTGPLISESFTSSAASFTRVSGGTWAVSSGRYVLTAPAATAVPNANLSVHNTTVAGDFTLSAAGSTTPTASTFNDFSIVFGYRDASNYSFASFSEGNDSATNGVFRVSGGVATQLVDFTSTITAGTMYPVRIERQGTTVRVYRGGTLVATTTDSSFTSGRVGFGTKNDGASFDDLVVTAATSVPRAPGAPTGVAATAGNASATVTWAAPADGGSSAITGYRVRRYSGTGTTLQATTTVAATARTFTATGLTNGTPYSFDVAAVNAAGTGAASTRSNAVTPTGTATAVIGDQTVGTKWTAATGDSKRVSRFSAAGAVAATLVRAYLDGNSGTAGSQSLRAVIYTDANGAPATRLTSSAGLTITAGRTAGWVTFTLPTTVTLNANTAYWIGLHSGPTRVARFAGTTVTSALRYNTDTYSDGAASPFGTAGTDATRLSIYASSG